MMPLCRHSQPRHSPAQSVQTLTLPRLDRGILFRGHKKDRPVKPGEGEFWGVERRYGAVMAGMASRFVTAGGFHLPVRASDFGE